MKTKHTPGPWLISGSMTRSIEARISDDLIQEVAACGPTLADNGYGQQQEANARLIAAAPVMYSLLEKRAECGDDEAKAILEEIDNG